MPGAASDNLPYRYRMIMSAIDRISSGERDLRARAVIKDDYGRIESIEECLNTGSAFGSDSFNETHLDGVEAAFASLGATRPSEQVSECCAKLRELMASSQQDLADASRGKTAGAEQ